MPKSRLEVMDRWVMDHRVRRDMLVTLLIAFGMLLVAVTVCVGLLSASPTAIPIGAAAVTGVAGTAVVVRRRRGRTRRGS